MYQDSEARGPAAGADELRQLTVDIAVAAAEVRVSAGARRGRRPWILDPRLALADLRVRAREMEGTRQLREAPAGADEAPLPEAAGGC